MKYRVILLRGVFVFISVRKSATGTARNVPKEVMIIITIQYILRVELHVNL